MKRNEIIITKSECNSCWTTNPLYFWRWAGKMPHKKKKVLESEEIKKFQKNSWNTWSWWEIDSKQPKKQILKVVLENFEKSAVKHSIEKPIILNFLLSKIVWGSSIPFLTRRKPLGICVFCRFYYFKSLIQSLNWYIFVKGYFPLWRHVQIWY